ncbi:MAG TPA: hypothetical protein VJA46_06020 [Acidimicrobiia bacterium]|nr:hypothetical protein [Acidimicrobiia bacterium]
MTQGPREPASRERLAFRIVVGVAVLVVACGGSANPDEIIEQVDEAMAGLAQARGPEVNDLITQCMRAQGFTGYLATAAESWQEPPLTTPSGEIAEGYERVEYHGFGIASGYLSIYENEDVPDWVRGGETPAADEDPAEQAALWSTVEIDGEIVQGGCTAWANGEWEGAHPEWAAGQEFQAGLRDFLELAERDPQVAALNDELAACIRSEGYTSVQNPDDVYGLVRTQIESINPDSTEREYVAAMEDIRQYEIGLAKSVWECSERLRLEERRSELASVFQEYRSRFVAENQDLVETLD